MRPVFRLTAFLGLIFVVTTSTRTAEPALDATPAVLRVRDFGAVPDGKSDAGPGIRAALSAAGTSRKPTEVLLETGSYRVRPETPRQSCFPITHATNLVVRGTGPSTKIVIEDPAASGFSLSLCQQVTVRDLTVDYDPLPFLQGLVRGVNPEAGSFDVEVETDYPTPDADNFHQAVEPYGKWGMIIDPATRRIRSGTPDHFMTPRWEHQGGRVWRFFTADEHHRRNLKHLRVGDSYVHLARGHGCVVIAQGCDGIRILNLRVHASPGLVVGLVGNRGDIIVRRLDVRFAPGTTRLLTANADGVHGQQNRSGPIIEDCYFEGMADDAVNLYAPPNVLLEVRSPTRWLVTPSVHVLPGDRLQVLDPQTGRVRGVVKATEVTLEQRALLLTLDAPLEGAIAGADHRRGDTLYDLDACGAGFQIRRNRMNGNRRYGALLRAGGGIIEDNAFDDTTGAGVVLTNEPDWPEGPVPWDITIRRNRFLRGGTCLGYADSPQGAALILRPTRLGHALADAPAIRDVVIENNVFRDQSGGALFVGGSMNVTIRSNQFTASPTAELRRQGPAILIERSSLVTLLDNAVADPRSGTTAAVEIGPGVSPGELGTRVSGLKTTLAPSASPILDRRAAP